MGLALALLMVSRLLFAAPTACTCKHLESIQQELENAIYLQQFQKKLSDDLKKVEQDQRDLKKKEPANPLGRRAVKDVSEDEWAKRKAAVKLPNARIKGDTGPSSVGLEEGTCDNRQADLDALKAGAACKELGDISLRHEAGHRKKCSEMGKDKYWARLYSEIAAEEAERYAEQLKATRALLKKVIDGSTVKISEDGDMQLTSNGGFAVTYKISMPPYVVKGNSSEASDEWTMTGTGTQTTTVTSMKLPGLTCTPDGGMKDSPTGTLTLDGLKMKLDVTTVTQGGKLSATCSDGKGGNGFGYSMAPPGETGQGNVFSDERVKLKAAVDKDLSKAMPAQGGVALTGTITTKVEITCKK
jgi:hypothetical protein